MNAPILVLVLAAALAAACANLAPEQREVVLSADRLEALLARRLVVDKKLFDTLELHTGKPSVLLDAQAQRLRIDLPLRLEQPFSSHPLQGHAAISGGLAFDEPTRTVLLTDPRVEQLDFQSVPALLRDPVRRLAGVLGAELLDRYPLATLKPDQLTVLGQEYRVLGFEIAPDALKVILRRKP